MKERFLVLFLPFLMTLKDDNQGLTSHKEVISESYATVKIDGDTIKLNQSNIELDKDGFPKQIQTFYDRSKVPTSLLYEGIHFHFLRKSDGKNINLEKSGVKFLNGNDKLLVQKSKVKWKATSENDSLTMEVTGMLKPDGVLFYKVKVTALQALSLSDVTMHIPFIKTVATRVMGFGLAESTRPEKIEWKWDGAFKAQNGAWLGNQDAGMKYILEKGDWSNKGNGGVSVGIKGSSMLSNNYTGQYTIEKGEVRYYNFQLIIKPLGFIKK